MIASPTDAVQPSLRKTPQRLLEAFGSVATGLVLVLGLISCSEAPLPQKKLRASDCLHRIDLNQLKQALQRCDQVVRAFPANPQPRNERFLLHALMGENTAACKDIAEADRLMQRKSISPDSLLRQEITLRLQSCRD